MGFLVKILVCSKMGKLKKGLLTLCYNCAIMSKNIKECINMNPVFQTAGNMYMLYRRIIL